MDAILKVNNLTTVLDLADGTVPVVDDVSFDVGVGETLGIVGESGSGKSMTALSIMRVLPQPIGRIDSGSVFLGGENLLVKSDKEMTAVRGSRLGMILQDPHTSLNPVMSIGKQVIEALNINKPKTSRSALPAMAIDALKKVNVADPEHRINAFPHQMSGGMKQRVVGAIAIAGAPELIIADEPTTALDVTIQLQYLDLLKTIQTQTGMAIVFITHDLGIVANLCHKLVVMYAGKIVERGTVKDVFEKPSHPYTEALLKSVPSVERSVERLFAIEGQPPGLTANRKGCSFAPRCRYATSVCYTQTPEEVPGLSEAPDHRASCLHMARTP
ncbi:MAG: ABC transporter ATP-binding protein [Granulosicoccus sp.]